MSTILLCLILLFLMTHLLLCLLKIENSFRGTVFWFAIMM